MFTLDTEAIDTLIRKLAQRGYTVIGPTVRDRAIVYDQIGGKDDLPVGWTDEQDNGTYRIRRRDDEALFGYAVGPASWKKFLFPPRLKLWEAARDAGGGFEVSAPRGEAPAYAFFGVRACELAAIAVQDKVFMEGPQADPVYKARREKLLIVAVNCGQAAKTCFCTSMDTGPRARSGYDLALTEVMEEGRHYFVADAATDKGQDLLAAVARREADAAEIEAGGRTVQKAVSQITRRLETDGIKDLLYKNMEHPRWDEVADRCLSCGNCTMACPTCFCHTVEDVTDLSGDHAERWRMWDSCFTMEFSYIHGGNVRATTRSRYRQWMTHKLASWQDQFGTSGCVGCGRCITWCPVGIDITEEARVIRAQQPAGPQPA